MGDSQRQSVVDHLDLQALLRFLLRKRLRVRLLGGQAGSSDGKRNQANEQMSDHVIDRMRRGARESLLSYCVFSSAAFFRNFFKAASGPRLGPGQNRIRSSSLAEMSKRPSMVAATSNTWLVWP